MNGITLAAVVPPFVPGDPVVWLMGMAVLGVLLVKPVKEFAQPLLTIANEGGHMILAVLSGRGLKDFGLSEDGGGVTNFQDGSWGVGLIFTAMAGYLTPPLVGLAGAGLIASDRAWSFLWVGVVLLLGAWSQFSGAIAGVMVALFGIGIGWVALSGSPELQVTVALALAWLMLLGGVENVWVLTTLRREPRTDAAKPAKITWIPGILWIAGFWSVALLCLWFGGRTLLGI